jgi:hypothetical protein
MMNKSIAQILLGALLVVGVSHSSWSQATKPTTPTTQPTPSMQEQYDKLHGNTQKKTTTPPSKSKTTTKPQTTQKPAKTAPAPKAQVAEKPKASSGEEEGFKFKVGLRGGANYASVTSDQLKASGVNIDPILGYHGGLILSLGGKTFSVQPEILYSQLGFKLTAAQGGASLVGESKVNTITVPVLLKVALGSEKLKFFVNGGGYGSYALNGKAKTTFNGATTTSDIDYEKGDARIEYGAVGGAGVALGLGGAQLLIEGRYYYGLGNNGEADQGDKIFYRNIQASVGILIPLGGK